MARRRLELFEADQLDEINKRVREAAVEIMNQLGAEGPAWSGELRDSWRAVAVGPGTTAGEKSYWPYQLRDVPRLELSAAEYRRRSKFRIENEAPYAPYALDLEPGKFFRPDEEPEPIDQGKWQRFPGVGRPSDPHLRPEVGGDDDTNDKESSITAEEFWYEKFVTGNDLVTALRKGFTRDVRTKGRINPNNVTLTEFKRGGSRPSSS